MKKVYISVFLFLLVFGVSTKNVFAISNTPDNSFPGITEVMDMVYDSANDIIYVAGGDFNYHGKTALMAIHATDGSLVNTFNPVVDGGVFTLYLDGSTLYIGGIFTHVGGVSRNSLAAVSTADGSVLAFNPNLTSTNPNTMVADMQLLGNTLYVGGNFEKVGGQDQAYLAAIDTNTGSLITGFNPVFTNDLSAALVNSLYLDGTTLYVGSDFYTVDGDNTGGLTAFNVSNPNVKNRITNISLFSVAGDGGVVYGLDLSGGILYFTGIFNQIQGQAREDVAAINTTTGSLDVFNPVFNRTGMGLLFNTVVVHNNDIYLASMFDSVNGVSRNSLVSVDKNTGLIVNPFDANLGALTSIGIWYFNNYLYVGGDFTTPRVNLARFQDATPGVTLSKTTVNATEGGAGDSYTLVLDSQPTANVVITPTADSQSSVSPATLTFTSANWNTPQTITITAVDDSVDEASPHSSTIIHTAVSTDANYNGISISNVTVSITDNDTSNITLSKTTANVTEGGAGDSYTLVLDSQPTANVVITPTADSQSSVSPATLTFTSANWNTPQTIAITAVDDNFIEDSPHNSTITHTVTSGDANYNNYSISSISVSITDNDFAGGLSSEAYRFPDDPLLISINREAKCTDSRNVKLKLTTGGRTKYIAISNDFDFSGKSLELFSNNEDFGYILDRPYTEYKNYTLSDGYGKKTVYLKYYTAYGRSSEIISDSIIYTNNLQKCLSDNNQKKATEKKDENTDIYLFKYAHSPQVYLLENNKKRWIVSEKAFNQHHYQWSDIKVLDDDLVYSDGENIIEKEVDDNQKNNYQFTRFLTIGSVGDEVRHLQSKLKELGYFTYEYITGYYGNVTAQAVRLFQKAQGIVPVGYVGPQTRGALNK